MKNIRSILLLLPFVAVFARAEEAAEASERFSILGLSVEPDTQYPSGRNSNIRGVSLSLLVELRNNVRGVAVGSGASMIENDMTGIQFALVASGAGKLNGIQAGGLFAGAGSFDGVIFTGLFNITGRGQSRGLQIAGLGNLPFDKGGLNGGQIALLLNGANDLKGFQIGIGINAATEINGLQIAGVFNYAETLRGLQIGAVNVVENGSGLQIGLLNFFGTGDNRLIFPLLNARF